MSISRSPVAGKVGAHFTRIRDKVVKISSADSGRMLARIRTRGRRVIMDVLEGWRDPSVGAVLFEVDYACRRG